MGVPFASMRLRTSQEWSIIACIRSALSRGAGGTGVGGRLDPDIVAHPNPSLVPKGAEDGTGSAARGGGLPMGAEGAGEGVHHQRDVLLAHRGTER